MFVPSLPLSLLDFCKVEHKKGTNGVDGNTLNRVWLELDYRLDVWPSMIHIMGKVYNIVKELCNVTLFSVG